jgi:hypothetical protein
MARPVIVALVGGVCVVGATLALALGGGRESRRGTTPQSASSTSPRSTSEVPARPRSDTTGEGWPYDKLIRELHGVKVAVGRRTVRVDRGLLTCSGNGPPVLRGGARRWKRFTCTQTSFPGAAVGDLSFDVAVASRDRVRITSERYGPE